MVINKTVLIAAVGDNSLHKIWIEGRPKFDLFLIYYGEQESRFCNDSKYYLKRKGNKYNLIYDVLNEFNDELSVYDNFFLLDDDLYITCTDINRFLKYFDYYQLELAQPSIAGWYGPPITLTHPMYALRYTNYVEIMLPCFSRDALFTCKETFIVNKTGWGIDFVWPLLLNQEKIAIIDDVVAFHTRQVMTGDCYKSDPYIDFQKAADFLGVKTDELVCPEVFWSRSIMHRRESLSFQYKYFPYSLSFVDCLEQIRQKQIKQNHIQGGFF